LPHFNPGRGVRSWEWLKVRLRLGPLQKTTPLLVMGGGGWRGCTRNGREKQRKRLHWFAATASWRTEKNSIRPSVGVKATRRMGSLKSSRRDHPRSEREVCSLATTTPHVCPLRSNSSGGLFHARSHWGFLLLLQHHQQHETDLWDRVPNVKFASGQHDQSSDCSTADYDRIRGCCVGERKNICHSKKKIVLNLMKQNSR
jgi:hypothetical protein